MSLWDVDDLKDVLGDHGTHPRNFRLLDPFDCAANGDNPLCGDQVHLRLALGPGGVVTDLAFQGRGCALSRASASLMTLAARGLTPEQALALAERVHRASLGEDVPQIASGPLLDPWETAGPLTAIRFNPLRVKCVTLAWHTLRAALEGQGAASTE